MMESPEDTQWAIINMVCIFKQIEKNMNPLRGEKENILNK